MKDERNDCAAAAGRALERLMDIVERLRDPETGCPWDKVQTLSSIKPCLVEECYELLDKMDSGDVAGHREELGDVMLQLVFQASLRRQRGEFALADAIDGICDKLVRRHPHVFGDLKVDGASDVLANWERIKRAEGKGDNGEAVAKSPFAGVPKALPALLKAQRIQSKAARAGYEPYPKATALEAVEESLESLKRVVAENAQPYGSASDSATSETASDAIGALLFRITALARALDADAETALERRCSIFMENFKGCN